MVDQDKCIVLFDIIITEAQVLCIHTHFVMHSKGMKSSLSFQAKIAANKILDGGLIQYEMNFSVRWEFF